MHIGTYALRAPLCICACGHESGLVRVSCTYLCVCNYACCVHLPLYIRLHTCCVHVPMCLYMYPHMCICICAWGQAGTTYDAQVHGLAQPFCLMQPGHGQATVPSHRHPRSPPPGALRAVQTLCRRPSLERGKGHMAGPYCSQRRKPSLSRQARLAWADPRHGGARWVGAALPCSPRKGACCNLPRTHGPQCQPATGVLSKAQLSPRSVGGPGEPAPAPEVEPQHYK